MLRRLVTTCLATACTLVACAPVANNDAAPRSTPVPEPPAPSTVPPLPAASAAVSPPPVATSATPPAPAGHPDGPLRTFYDALDALERGQRKDHVRIAWLGDSHAQADFWTDGIRVGLGKRFGRTGPGFLHLGMKSYRHAGTKIEIKGKWRMRPKQPSTIEPWGDGAFGLGGILHAGFAEYRHAQIALVDEALAGKPIKIDLCYKLGLQNDVFELFVGGKLVTTIRAEDKDDLGKLQHHELDVVGPTTVKVRIKDGRPDFCGLAVETDPTAHPGVVLDNLGINGARYATALAWNEQAWAQEVARRKPDLFIFEYGGNEAGDYAIDPPRYKANALELVARARRIRPDVSCWMVGPSDRADAESKIPPINEALKGAAKEAGCAYWDTYAVMGGKGSLRRWRDLEKAAPDGVHLKPKGYAEVSALMLADLMKGYRPR
jgi:lysophospholipase L1-like esterase